MNAGYVRLSRDDDKRNYVSIENQKLIISQYAAEQNIRIHRWYEDDGISGYVFDRPGFSQLMEDLDKDIDTVFVKDFSRLGRHNAKVLLLLDEFRERGKHLIVIDDSYDSRNPEDDTIGIKTWYNERYVKDTSKKIKRAIGARQKEGSLRTQPPFGYARSHDAEEIIEIVPMEAEYIRLIYDLYLNGYGYRKIANHLTAAGISTPSMVRHEREIKKCSCSKRPVALQWSDGMVKAILDNDFYTGTFRLRKRARATVHGKDKRIPKEEQYVFEDHHPPIIGKMTFDLVQDEKAKRIKYHYRGNRSLPGSPDFKISNPFRNCLFCKDCKSPLTPIIRKTTCGQRAYYICSKYNTKGSRYCPKAHLIETQDLTEDVIACIRLCRNFLHEAIAGYNPKDFAPDKKSPEEKRLELESAVLEQKNRLKTLFFQKVKDLSGNPDKEALITEGYESLQNDILSHIHSLELQLQSLNDIRTEASDERENLMSPLDVMDELLEKRNLTCRDVDILIEKITVDQMGMPEIELKYELSGFLPYSPANELNSHENKIIHTVMNLILEDMRGYTSAKYLSAKLSEAGFKMNSRQVLPYIRMLLKMGIIKPSGNSRKPYTVIKSYEEIRKITESNLHCYGDGRWYAGDGI